MKSICKLDEKMQDELNSKIKKKGKIITIFASVLMLLYIVLEVIDVDGWYSTFSICMGAILLMCGLFILFSVKNAKKLVIGKNISLSYEFEEEFMNIATLNNDEQIAINKVYYKDLIKVDVSENYIFLYVNKMQAHPILKRTLTKEELEKLKSLILKYSNIQEIKGLN